ncbi:MAG: hypothetical protein RR350_01095 [Oscillibacter sp.]
MNSTEATEVLNHCYETMFSAPLYASACKGYRRLRTRVATRRFSQEGQTAERVLEALNHLPVMFLDKQTPEHIQVVMGGGAANLNPVVMEIQMDAPECTVTVWTKEGLLPQKSAEKAISRFQKLLQLECIGGLSQPDIR